MSNKYKITEEEINQSVLHSPYSLPDSPAQKGLGAAQIKKYFYEFIRFFAQKLNLHLSEIGGDNDFINDVLLSLQEKDAELGTLVSQSISAHNEGTNTHADIRAKIGDDISLHNMDTLSHSDIRELIKQVSEAASSAYDLASGKCKVHPVAKYTSLAEYLGLFKGSTVNVGDLLVIGEKNVPDFMVFAIDEADPEYDAELPTDITSFELVTGNKYYHKETGIVLLAIESGIDTSKLTLKEEFESFTQGFDSYSSDMEERLSGIETELATKEAAKTRVNETAESVILENGKELSLGLRTSIILSLPETLEDDYEVIVNFRCGATETSFDAPDEIIFTQDDCLEGRLYPLSNRIYEINIKKVCGYLIAKVGCTDYGVIEA